MRLVDAAKATKVAAPDLVALEYQDFDVLPDDEATVTAYVRMYAEYLGLEPGPLVAECTEELAARRPELPADGGEEDVEPPAQAPDESGSRRVVPRFFVIAGGLVVLLLLVGWWWLGAGDSREPAIDGGEPRGEATADAPPATAPPQVESGSTESEPVESPPPADPEPQPPPARLSVAEHGVGTGVVNRGLVGAGNRFVEGNRIWFWTLVQGGRAGDTIEHLWIRDGQVTNRVPLEVDGPYWRTQSRKTLKPGSRGHRVAEARDAAGNLLARSEFECVAP